jgi:DNA-binding NtrC family response regulator
MPERILVVDDEEIIRNSISFILRKEGYSVTEAANGREAYDMVLAESFDIIVTDLEMPEMKGIELLERVVQISPQLMVIIITAYGSLETAIAALRKGASDYILKPIEFDELLVKIRRLLDQKQLMLENQLLRREVNREYNFNSLVGKSPAIERVFEVIRNVSVTDSTVLVSGSSGTGKELVARAIHFNSKRATRPFIAVNCAAIPDTLMESELFGHRKGAFTGAITDKMGYFKAADGGTLFLDEISEMPLNLQVKLLRAIEQKEITPVGTASPLTIDVRFLASTNRKLLEEVEAGRFRKDLYYRLNVVEIILPPLSERREDIPLLVEHFLDKYRREMGKHIKGVDDDAMRLLIQHEWKGEIRELENIIERGVIFCKGEYLTLAELPEFLHTQTDMFIPHNGKSLEEVVHDLERQYILSTLKQHNFNKDKTAEVLHISLPTLYRRIKDLNIS